MPDNDADAPLLPVKEIVFVQDPTMQDLNVYMGRMEAYAEGRHPYVVSGRVCECEAVGKRLEVPGFGSIGNTDILSAAEARGCDVGIIARRIMKKLRKILLEETARLHESVGDDSP